MAHVTAELHVLAFDALASGNRAEIDQYWDQNMRWQVPGHNPVSGWYYGLDGFLGFMGQVGLLSNNSFTMSRSVLVVSDEWSVDVTRNNGYRAGHENSGTVPYTKLDIDAIHLLRWRNGKVIEGRGAIFGDGTSEYNMFWSPVGSHGGERLNTRDSSIKGLIRQVVEDVWNANAQDRVPEFYGENYVFFQEGGGAELGRDSVKRWLDTTHTAFPDLHYVVDAVYADVDGEKAAMRYHVCGTHTGDFRGLPPTNKQIELTGHMMFRVLDGKIVTAHGYWDVLGLMQQLGILPPFGGPGR